MKILITNDDGIDSPALEALEGSLGTSHEIWVFAPDRERSGQSHSITLRGPVRVKKRAERWFSCDGTPADCIIVGLKGGFVPLPDVIISGINLGPNLGTDTIYSGTVAGARQGAIMGIKSLALSSAVLRGPWDLQGPADWLAKNLVTLLEGLPDASFLNINFPSPLDPSAQVQEATLSKRVYHDKIESFLAPGSEHFCFVKGALGEEDPLEGNDWWAVNRGRISLTALSAQPIEYSSKLLEVRL